MLAHFNHFNFIIEDGFANKVFNKVFYRLFNFSIRLFINPLAQEARESGREHIKGLNDEFKEAFRR